MNCQTHKLVAVILLYKQFVALTEDTVHAQKSLHKNIFKTPSYEGPAKSLCHWVRITSALHFIKHIFITNLGVWEGLRFVIVALPGLFSYLLFKVFPFTETHFCNLFTQS